MNHPPSEAELQCLQSVQRAADALGVAIFAVGANARRLVFNIPSGVPIYRTTADWDFGVRVPDWSAFQRIRMRLLNQQDCFEPGRYEHELIHRKTGIRIDLVPFGGLENEGRIRWPESAFEMNVFGFSEACENAVHLELSPDCRMAVATVPMLIALKFFAFEDRKNETDRDLNDLWHVIRNYGSKDRESAIFEEPFSKIIDASFDWECADSLLLGYDVSRACKLATIERLIPIVEELTNPYSAHIGKLIPRSFSQEQEETERLRASARFRWLMKGLQIPR